MNMYCDYDELENYAAQLDTIFNKINSLFDSIEQSYKTLYDTSNWNSLTRTYFYNQAKSVYENMESATNKFHNIKLYLDNVVSNYRVVDNGITDYFQFKVK